MGQFFQHMYCRIFEFDLQNTIIFQCILQIIGIKYSNFQGLKLTTKVAFLPDVADPLPTPV